MNRNKKLQVGINTNGLSKASLDSALVFKGRLILKRIYAEYQLLEKRDEPQIQMPCNCMLRSLSDLEMLGLDAAHEHLAFSHEGVSIKGCEGTFSHHSREKLAILYIVINSELVKPLLANAMIRDEVTAIRKMSELVDWICNMQSEKDLRARLEKPLARLQLIQPQALIPEKLLSLKELAAQLGVSERTIRRHPEQFKPIQVGKRSLYRLSDCVALNS